MNVERITALGAKPMNEFLDSLDPVSGIWAGSGNCRVVYGYERPFPNGSAHVVLEPLDFMARLASLVPRPRSNLTRFHGVLAPNFRHRHRIVPRHRKGRVDGEKLNVAAPAVWVLGRFRAGAGCTVRRSSPTDTRGTVEKGCLYFPSTEWRFALGEKRARHENLDTRLAYTLG